MSVIYKVGIYDFIRWNGPTPQLVKQHLARFVKPGQAGFSAQALGIYGDPFTVDLESVWATQLAGQVGESGYRNLIGAATQQVVHNGVNYQFRYQHTYLVENVEITSFKTHPLLMGVGYNFPSGWLLKSRWTLVPFTPG
jgi:hypothetical protein